MLRTLSCTAARARDGVHVPLARNALERVRAPILEDQLRSDHQIPDGLGDGDLGRSGEGGHARADVHGQAADLVADPLHLAGVHPGAHLEAEETNGGGDGCGAVDGAGGPSNEAKKPSPAVSISVPR